MDSFRLYFKMLRWLWFNRGWDDLLSFSLFLAFLPVVFWLLWCLAGTVVYTYLYLRKRESIHNVFQDMIDRRGIWKCRLHDYQYSTDYCSPYRELTCPKRVWSNK